MKHIAIVGTSPSYRKVKDFKGEIWTVPGGVSRLKKISIKPNVIFELHKNPSVWLQRFPSDVYLSYPNPNVPKGIIIPKKELVDIFGNVFHSSIVWMLGMAILKKPDSIYFFGVDQMQRKEYLEQRDGLFYLMGWAECSGIKINILPNSKINLKGKALYGHFI